MGRAPKLGYPLALSGQLSAQERAVAGDADGDIWYRRGRGDAGDGA
jgi:hypothetical protein